MSPSLITEESLTKWGEGVANCCFCYVKEYHVEESWFVKGYRAEGFGGVRDILDRPRWGGGGGNVRLYQIGKMFYLHS